MATRSFLSVILFASSGFADVSFTSPAAGADVPAGTIKVQWEESNISPLISELTQYTLSLMMGGNDDGNMVPLTTFVSQGTFPSGNFAEGTIPTGIAGELTNGFFFRIISTRQEGGTVTDYSSRFSLTGLTGTTPLQYSQAVLALGGSTDGPTAVGNNPSSTVVSSPTTTASIADSLGGTAVTAQATPTATDADASSATTTIIASSIPTDSPAALSLAAKAGIAAACILFTLVALASAAACLLVRRRRAKQNVTEMAPEAPQNPFLDHKAELSAEMLPPPRAYRRTLTQMSELSADSRVYELGDGARPPELDHMTFRAELDGSPVTESRPKPAGFI